jgi:hypothetical protein
MRAGVGIGRLAVLLLATGLVVACATPRRPAWTPVPIPNLASVSGKWAGVLLRDPTDRRDDWLELTIAPDGSFQAKSYRLIGAMTGSGQFTLADGKLNAKSPRATTTGTLYEAEGQRMLRIEAVTPEGLTFRSDTLRDR